ncbi:exodeoxyribonuclease III [Pseudomarimonas salicorniae]|uniref:Exodeoxyribonuclease III n=1 Tax=Pseudomarimonas salicorniae TaxID=2933270 RepID=A0ABT0GDB3_9GAMM|nr:exodeoxyribonuclease III [Lysobacter sp. CAU 1642]MCK7592541.1 exodeoxyribonuclease III [Lysobacter sp. CAU 1642]
MRIVSFNANGLRSAATKGFFDWFAEQDIDLLCVQETKAQTEQLQDQVFCPSGYHRHFHDARCRRGYSGVAVYSRQAPDEVCRELGWEEFDCEGRYLEARFGSLSVVSLYLPSGSSGDERQGYKFRVMEWFAPILEGWLRSGRDYVVCGDWNIVHTEKDIRNWKSNQKNSGCLPEERAWLGELLSGQGWVDAYRRLRPDGEDYTWWSQRGAARAKDVGWRIDYQLVSPGLAERLRDCAICPRELRFSDHAPFIVDYR